ncbi:MAG TPA: ATP-binding protein [Chitinophagaceae bacterium]|nr:ATP-binding protein [Chitinophagaceae bacterium]
MPLPAGAYAHRMATEPCIPNPEFLIKSIAEQGYTLETSIADLVDNSVSAGAQQVEILVDTQTEPFILFIADDGKGMSPEELRRNMAFPSNSPESNRAIEDMGRFGLGLKTASFAQTRCFTVVSRKAGTERYSARTWDVEHLKKGNWEIIINSEQEIEAICQQYYSLSKGFYNSFHDYRPNTIIVWRGLYKFEKGDNLLHESEILQNELTGRTQEYLQLIFHRFMEKPTPLRVRLNNSVLTPFDPFPARTRRIPTRQKILMGNKLKLEGFVLPNSSLTESKSASEWTLKDKSLIDMEGIYVYRADRLIVFGGWQGLVKKRTKLQLARLRVEIDNGIDHLFHLNVAKSSIIIPFSERRGFQKYILELIEEARKEIFNYEVRGKAVEAPGKRIFRSLPTSRGIALAIDEHFPLLHAFTHSLTALQQKQLKILLRMFTTKINQTRQVHTDDVYTTVAEKDGITEESMLQAVKTFIEGGITKNDIVNELIPAMGIDIASLPASVLSLLK